MSTIDLPLRLEPGPGTLHARITAAIRRALREQRVPPDSVLPTAGDVAASLGVNVNTALRAYRALADEGILELRRGHGPRVRETPEHIRLHELAEELAAEAARLGLSRGELVALVLDHA